MSLQFRLSQFEMDMELYIVFLLEHHDELNLPYSFAMKLSFIASPLVLGKALMIFNEEPYEIIGTAGFVYGTGAHDYEDQHICQVEVAFIKKAYRRTFVFVQGLKELVNAIKADNEAVKQVQFWTSVDQLELDRLLDKFTLLPHATKSIVNNMAFYTIPFKNWSLFASDCETPGEWLKHKQGLRYPWGAFFIFSLKSQGALQNHNNSLIFR